MYAAFGWVDALVLGLVQGLTEFLPISSSAHLRILGPLLPGGGDPGAAFTAITLVAQPAAFGARGAERGCQGGLAGDFGHHSDLCAGAAAARLD